MDDPSKECQLSNPFSLESISIFKLGPATRCGISTLANCSKDIENILHNLEFKILPCLGVNQHVKTEWHKIACVGLNRQKHLRRPTTDRRLFVRLALGNGIRYIVDTSPR